MRRGRRFAPMFLFAAICLTHPVTFPSAAVHSQSEAEPEHARWSSLVIREAQLRYTVLDFKYLGKTEEPPNMETQSFRLWVRKDGREFGVRATVTYEPGTGRLIALKFEEAVP